MPTKYALTLLAGLVAALAYAAPPPPSVTGRVTDPRGAPIGGAKVWVVPAGADPAAWETAAKAGPQLSGEDGSFVLRGLPAGHPVHLEICRDDFEPQRLFLPRPGPEPVLAVLPAAPPPPPSHAARISGQAVDAQGRPVAGARILVEWGWNQRVDGTPLRSLCRPDPLDAAPRSDGEGRFVLGPLRPSGRYEVTAVAGGYLRSTKAIDLAPDHDVSGVKLVLERGAVITGVLTGTGRKPIASARVKASGRRSTPEALTDSQGHFRLENVEPGKRWLVMVAEGYGSATSELSTPVFDVRKGEQRRDVSVAEYERRRVSGRVVDGDGSPVAGAQVWETAGTSTLAAGDGSFELFLADGHHYVLAQQPGFADTRNDVMVARSPVTGVTLRMQPGAVVTGRVLGLAPEDGEATIEAGAAYANPPVGRHRTVAGPDGRYRLPDLAPGEWSLTAYAGDRHVSYSLHLPPGQAETIVRDLELWPRVTARGRVLGPDGAPIQGAQVRLRGSSARGETMTTGADGTISFRVDPGTYDFAARYGGFGLGHAEAPVQVPGGPPEGATIRLGPPAVLDGHLHGLASADLAEAVLRVHDLEDDWQPYIERDGQGAFHISELGSGDWEIFSGSDGRQETATVHLQPGGRGTLDIAYALGNYELSVCFEGNGTGRGMPLVLRRAESPEGPNLAFDETDIYGCVYFARLAAGRYLLVDGDPGARFPVPVQHPGSRPAVRPPAPVRHRQWAGEEIGAWLRGLRTLKPYEALTPLAPLSQRERGEKRRR